MSLAVTVTEAVTQVTVDCPDVAVDVVSQQALATVVTPDPIAVDVRGDEVAVTVVQDPVSVVLEVSKEEEVPALQKRIDDTGVTSPAQTYVGEAQPGVLESGAQWRIFRLTEYDDGDVAVDYADNEATFDKTWDDRASYSYG